MNRYSLKDKITFSFLLALLIIFCFTPLGSIPIGPIMATLSMIPVIIAGLLYGKVCGMLMGLFFAIFSFIYWTFIMPTYVTAFLFSPFASFASYKGNVYSIIICFVPRIIAGLISAVIGYSNEKGSYIYDRKIVLASIFGSLTNTIFVLLFIFLFFGNEYKEIAGKAFITIILTTIITNGIPEAIIASIVCPPLVKIGKKYIL